MEAEARVALQEAVGSIRPSRRLGTFIREQFAQSGGVDLPVAERDSEARVADLT